MGKVIDPVGLHLPLAKFQLNLVAQRIAAPPVLMGLLRVPESFGGLFLLIEQNDVVRPTDLSLLNSDGIPLAVCVQKGQLVDGE